jgi:acyl-coenzyme A thioesterase PaaI-like protein
LLATSGVWFDQSVRMQEAVAAGEQAALGAIAHIRARGLHPFGYLAGVDGIAESGRASFHLPPEAVPAGAPPSIVGLATLADLALGAAAWTGAGAHDRVATTHLSLQVWEWPGEETITARAVMTGSTAHQTSSRTVLRAGRRAIGQGLAGFRRLPGQSGTMVSNPWARDLASSRPPLPEVEHLTLEERELLAVVRSVAEVATLEAPLLVQLLRLSWSRDEAVDGVHATLVPGWHIGNVAGHVQGGAVAGALALAGQAAVGCAPRQPIELSVQYPRPAAGPTLSVLARVDRRGHSTASGTARLQNEAGEAVAIGQFSYQFAGGGRV